MFRLSEVFYRGLPKVTLNNKVLVYLLSGEEFLKAFHQAALAPQRTAS